MVQWMVWLAALAWGKDPHPREVFERVRAHGGAKLPLGAETGCTKEMGATVGEYLSFLLGTAAAADPLDKVRIQAACSEKENLCSVEVSVVDPKGESPWNYGLRLKRGPKGKLTPVMCPGTP